MRLIGIDLGGGSIKGSVIDEKYNILRSHTMTVSSVGRPASETLADLAKLVLVLDGGEGIERVGIGIPGVVNDETGRVFFADNIGFRDVDAVGVLRELTGRRVRLINDANASALGESVLGAGRGARNMLMITLGTGVGGGIVIDGKLFFGSNGAAGEIGHTVIVKDGERCNCGRRGCFEAYASATALTRMTEAAMAEDSASLMHKIAYENGRVDGRTSFAAADRGDETARGVVEEYLLYLALGVTNLVNVFQPEVVVFSGGIANRGEELLAPLRERVYKEVYGAEFLPGMPRLVQAELGYEAGQLGAAIYAQLHQNMTS